VRLELADSDPIDYWVTFGAVGLAAVRFDVVLEVAGADQSAVRRLDDFLSVGTGNGSSLVDAVFKDPTFGGACSASYVLCICIAQSLHVIGNLHLRGLEPCWVVGDTIQLVLCPESTGPNRHVWHLEVVVVVGLRCSCGLLTRRQCLCGAHCSAHAQLAEPHRCVCRTPSSNAGYAHCLASTCDSGSDHLPAQESGNWVQAISHLTGAPHHGVEPLP
jgi:hypothetical protein